MTAPTDVWHRLGATGVVPVVVIDRAADAVGLVEVLEEAGLDAVEITLRTPAGLDAIAVARQASRRLLVGAGSVLTPDQVAAVHGAGAAFGVAPGLDRASVAAAAARGLPFVPGVATATEAMTAVTLGLGHLKFFPAATAGGAAALRALASPLGQTGVTFMPTGGIDADDVAEYLCLPNVFAVAGGWIAPRSDVRDNAWERIGARARAAVAVVAGVRQRLPAEDTP